MQSATFIMYNFFFRCRISKSKAKQVHSTLLHSTATTPLRALDSFCLWFVSRPRAPHLTLGTKLFWYPFFSGVPRKQQRSIYTQKVVVHAAAAARRIGCDTALHFRLPYIYYALVVRVCGGKLERIRKPAVAYNNINRALCIICIYLCVYMYVCERVLLYLIYRTGTRISLKFSCGGNSARSCRAGTVSLCARRRRSTFKIVLFVWCSKFLAWIKMKKII